MQGISTVVTERCIEITPIHAKLPPLSNIPRTGTEPSTNGFWSVLSHFPTATSVKSVAFALATFIPTANPQAVLLSALAGETKERVTSNETMKARDNIVFLWVLAMFVEWRNVHMLTWSL
jgi:hypothetical protein